MKKILPIVLGVIVVGGVAFYGGMQYGKSQDMGGSSTGQRNQQVGGFAGRRTGGMPNGGFTAGEILSKDEKSITLKLRDGGSKIIFLSSTTPVMKMISGSSNDLAPGAQITITGTTNSDGSITAQSIQLRPSSNNNQ